MLLLLLLLDMYSISSRENPKKSNTSLIDCRLDGDMARTHNLNIIIFNYVFISLENAYNYLVQGPVIFKIQLFKEKIELN